MSIASLSSSFRQQQLHSFEREREQPEQHFEQHHQHQQQQLLESINGRKEQVRNASLRVDVLECQIRDEVEKLFSLIGSSSHSIDSNSSLDHHKMNKDDKNKNKSHPNNIHQLEASILQLENELLDEQRTLAEYEQLYQVSLEQTKQRWKQQMHSRTKSL